MALLIALRSLLVQPPLLRASRTSFLHFPSVVFAFLLRPRVLPFRCGLRVHSSPASPLGFCVVGCFPLFLGFFF